jgi:xylulokinase
VSDVTGREQVMARASVGASYGAAYLAASTLGLVPPGSSDGWFQGDRRVTPDPASAAIHARGYAHFRQLYRDTRPVIHALATGHATDATGVAGPRGRRTP